MQGDAAADSTIEDSTWDFSPVFNLLKSLRTQSASPRGYDEKLQTTSPPENHATPTKVPKHVGNGNLGDFSTLWEYLGVQVESPTSSAAPPFETSTAESINLHDAYTSDGAMYYPPSASAEQQGSAPLDWTDTSADVTGQGQIEVTKKQLKMQVKKLKHEAQTPETQRQLEKAKSDLDARIKADAEEKRKRKAQKEAQRLERRRLELENSKSTATQNKAAVPAKQTEKTKAKVGNEQPAPKDSKTLQTPKKPNVTAAGKPQSNLAAQSQTPKKESSFQLPNAATTLNETLQSQKFQRAAPAQVRQIGTGSAFSATPSKSSKHNETETTNKLSFPTIQQQSEPRRRHEILPLANQTSIDRNWALLLKLLRNFPEDREHLLSPLQLSINMARADGIHVFVDASNILIGFYDCLKAARGIPAETRVPLVDLNFHALALLLERRRPVTKRVLAGSTPEIKAYDEARQVGYETCILDKVWKAKELTAKQKRYQAKNGYASGNGGYASGSDSAGNGNSSAALHPAKWVEQAVDEILHLKILESVIDTPVQADTITPPKAVSNGNAKSQSAQVPAQPPQQPRPTMVLATGDAAEAEYSAGFRKMVERALKSGWNVELMAFAKNISNDYRRMERLPSARGGWGERFKIIELDDYAEELFGQQL